MRILVSGASGFIGSELGHSLTAHGHEVLRLVRRVPTRVDEVEWHPESGVIPGGIMDDVDAVINLSGASLARLPWTPKWKREIFTSRIRATHTLTDAMRTASNPPAVFLSGSAVGIYGDRPGEKLTEASPRGNGYLADVVDAWEKAARRAPAGVRVVTMRTGLVVGQGGRSLDRRAAEPPRSRRTDGRRQAALALDHAARRGGRDAPPADDRRLRTGEPRRPGAASAERIMRAFTSALHRPYLLPAPKRIVSLALQDARDLLLADQEVVPQKLEESGFRFQHESAEQAIDWMLSGRRPRRDQPETRHARA